MADVGIRIQTKYDGRGFGQAERDSRRLAQLTKRLDRDIAQARQRSNLMRGAVGGASAILAGVGAARTLDFARESINLAREQAAAEAQLAAAIRSTGGAAGLTAAELKAMAGQLQSVTNFGDEVTIRAQAMLLTFVNVGEDTFPRATRAILDLSTAMDQGLKESAIQIGKALNDPIQGITALRRVGIQFTDAQEDQIKALAETNQLAEAQALILAELERQFGGSAEAARIADGNIIALGNAWGDLKEAIGAAIIPSQQGISDLIESIEWLTDRTNRAADGWREFAKNADIAVIGLHNIVFEGMSGGEAFTQAGQEVEAAWKKVEPAISATTTATEDNTAATEDNTEAMEEAARRLEQVAEIRRDAARDLLQIEEDAAEEVDEVWADYWDDQEDAWQDHSSRLADIRKRAADDAKKGERDLAKNLRRIDEDTEKRIAKVKEDAAKEERHEQKRRQVDVLGDERLFNFELQQLAAEGQGNAIREAIERRAIEEEIAKEKAAVEKEIETEQRRDQIATIRDTAAERRAQLREDHAEEKRLNEERLQEELAAEEASYAKRMIQLRDYRETKLNEVEAGKQEAVAKLGEELAEMDDLTRAELQALTPVAGELGEQAGKSFAEGLQRGFETNQKIDEMLGATPGAPSSLTPGMPHPGLYPRFQFGGTVPGPIGQPTMAIVHGGETVSPPGQSAHTFNVTVNASGGVDQGRIEMLFQQFTDEVLVPALS